MKLFFICLHMLLLTFAAYEGSGLFYKRLMQTDVPGYPDAADHMRPGLIQGENPDQQTQSTNYEIINSRNLFNVLVQKPESAIRQAPVQSTPEPMKKTELKLALWGTVISSSDSGTYAVIENQADRIQSLYQAGDSVADAVIKQIMRNKVILTVEGQDQVLEVDPGKHPPVEMSAFLSLPEIEDPFVVAPEEDPGHEPELMDMTAVMKQVRVRPYFSNGNPGGLLLYGIQNDSVFQKAGLRNGDIIQSMDGTPTLMPRDVQAIYHALQAGSEIRFTILRQGEVVEIDY